MQLTLIQGCCKLSWMVILFLCGERIKKKKKMLWPQKQTLWLFPCLQNRCSRKCSLGLASWKKVQRKVCLCGDFIVPAGLTEQVQRNLHFLRRFTWHASLCEEQTTAVSQAWPCAQDGGKPSLSGGHGWALFRNQGHSLWILDEKSSYEIFGEGTGITEVFFLKFIVDSGYIR